MKKQHIELSEADRIRLSELLSRGVLSVRTQKRATGLKYLDGGKTYQEVSDLLEVAYPTVLTWAKNYRKGGLAFLTDKPRSGRPVVFDGEERAKITALACTDAPEGYARWSLRLLADRLVELEIVDKVSYSEVGLILKKTNFSLTVNGNGASES